MSFVLPNYCVAVAGRAEADDDADVTEEWRQQQQALTGLSFVLPNKNFVKNLSNTWVKLVLII